MMNSLADALLLETKEERSIAPGSSHFRSRHFEKRAVKQSQFNASKSGLKDRSYMKSKSQKVISHFFDIILGEIDTDSE